MSLSIPQIFKWQALQNLSPLYLLFYAVIKINKNDTLVEENRNILAISKMKMSHKEGNSKAF